jgi:hypothetical protein
MIYAILNGANNSAMAILKIAPNAVALEKTIDWGSDGLNVSDLVAKDDKLFAVCRKTDSDAAVIAFFTGNETHTVISVDVKNHFPNTSAIVEPMNGDTLLLKNQRGFMKFNTATLIPDVSSNVMNDRSRYTADAVYDPEERKYYVAHNTAAGNSQGSVFSANYVLEKNFTGLGTTPAFLRFVPALSDNDRPEITTPIEEA